MHMIDVTVRESRRSVLHVDGNTELVKNSMVFYQWSSFTHPHLNPVLFFSSVKNNMSYFV